MKQVYLVSPLDSRGRIDSIYVVDREIFEWITSENPGIPAGASLRDGYADTTTPKRILDALQIVHDDNPAQDVEVFIDGEFHHDYYRAGILDFLIDGENCGAYLCRADSQRDLQKWLRDNDSEIIDEY